LRLGGKGYTAGKTSAYSFFPKESQSMPAAKTQLKNGLEFETTFYSNPKDESRFPFRATHMNGKRAPKVILCDDPRIQPGQLCKVRITSVKKPASKERGHIEVEFLSQVDFKIDDSLWVEPGLSLKLQALLESGMNILLDGPQGSGKTVLSRSIAEALGVEYVFFNCSAIYDATDFLATLEIKASATGQPETIWKKTDILRAIEDAHAEPHRRFLIFLDEFNRCREMARNGIMPALDSTRKMYNPLTGSTILIPENILWIAAINNGPQFTGTTNVDPAQLDRFAPLKVGYPPAKEEVAILRRKYPAASPSLVEMLVAAANAVRADEQLRVDLSMRATEEVCILLGHPNFNKLKKDRLADLLKTSFCGRFTGSWDDPATDAGLVWSVISKALDW
jgi:MoxR-like ATPase